MYLLGYCCKLVVIREQLCNYHVCFYVDWCNKSLIKKISLHLCLVASGQCGASDGHDTRVHESNAQMRV
jgi:hypothetical protein